MMDFLTIFNGKMTKCVNLKMIENTIDGGQIHESEYYLGSGCDIICND